MSCRQEGRKGGREGNAGVVGEGEVDVVAWQAEQLEGREEASQVSLVEASWLRAALATGSKVRTLSLTHPPAILHSTWGSEGCVLATKLLNSSSRLQRWSSSGLSWMVRSASIIMRGRGRRCLRRGLVRSMRCRRDRRGRIGRAEGFGGQGKWSEGFPKRGTRKQERFALDVDPEKAHQTTPDLLQSARRS